MVMYALVNEKRLDYMQAKIKTYADGTQILQSYNTDVVKRTPDGKLIRLWDSWSVTTMRQVRRWCGAYFRALPFEDGTYEDLRKSTQGIRGLDIDGCVYHRQREERNENAPTSKDQLTVDWYLEHYKTFYNKTIRSLIKGDKQAKLMLETANTCAKGNYIKHYNRNNWSKKDFPEPKTAGAIAAALCDYDFSKACCADNNLRVA